MPALVAFGHRWGIGSDDLAVPAALEAAMSATWLLIFGRTLYSQYGVLPAVPAVRQLLLGAGVLQSCNLLLLGCLIHKSFKGTVINTAPRTHISRLLASKMLYEGLTLCVSAATFHLVYVTGLDSVPQHLVRTVHNMSRGVWCVTAVSSLVLWHILNPYSRKRHDRLTGRDLEHVESMQETVTASWVDRFHSLGKFLDIEGHPALNKVGNLFSEYMQENTDLDLVATDVIAALMILVKKQDDRFARIERKSPSLGLAEPIPPDPVDWMTIHNAAHYMKYAAGCYGWPMYIWSSPLAMWGLLRVLVRSRYLPRSLPENVIRDNPLMVNTTVIKMVTGLTDQQLVLVSFHNKLFEVPYYVALDHEEKSVIVSIRGTLSFEDILTDLSAYDNRPIDIPGVPDAMAHEGMYLAAEFIQSQLLGTEDRRGHLEVALDMVQQSHRQEYKLVLVGHSLGAGVAAVLAILMRTHHKYGPNLQCFSYSPPGGLLNLAASTYAASFICSVVLGDDIVPRIGLINIHDLKVKVLETIRDLDVPKHQIFQGWFRNLLNTTLGVAGSDIPIAKDKHSWSDHPDQHTHVHTFQKKLQTSIDWSRRRIGHREQMFPAGCVMYIDPISSQKYVSTFVAPNSYLFGEIILSKTIIRDHTPWSVLHALRTLDGQT